MTECSASSTSDLVVVIEFFTGIASFRAANDSRPFIIHIGEEEYVAIDEAVLCTRFRLLESRLLVEREELDENGSIVRTVYVRPISTDRGLQFRVGTGRYSITGAQLNLGPPQLSRLSPQSCTSLDRRGSRSMISPLPHVAEVPEQSVEEISSDGSSVATTVLLDSNSETRTVIISSQRNPSPRNSGGNSGDGFEGAFYPGISRQPSSTSTVPTHSSETPSKKSLPQSPVYTTSESLGYKPFMRGVRSPRSSSETLGGHRSLAVSRMIAGKGFHSGGCSDSSVPSIYDSLLNLGSHRAGRSELKNVDLASFSHQMVNYLPTRYNGDIVFELPPLPNVKGGGAAMLEGMDRRRDGHAWTETATTNITDPDGQLSFRYVKCLEHLRCQNISCPQLERCGDYNEKY